MVMVRAATSEDRRDSWALLAIIAAFAILALLYNFIVPVFNAPDEPYHFEYVRHLAQNRRLPNQAIEEQATSNEGFNPPLYYLIGASLLALLSTDKASDFVVPDYRDVTKFRHNPYAPSHRRFFPRLNPRYSKWGRGREKDMFLRTAGDRFPFEGSVRSIHLLRTISVFFGALTILFLFKIAEALFPNERWVAILAAAICAFNPQFTFLHGYINNDTLVTTFSTISFWLLTRFILSRLDDPRWLIGLGSCVGLGLLSKLSIALVVPIAFLAVYLRASMRGQGVVRMAGDSGLLALPILVVSGWYFLLSVLTYGLDDPLGWKLRALQNPHLVLAPGLRGPFFKEVFFQQLFTSSWGQFDWLTILLPRWQYWIYGLISLMGLIGIGVHVRDLQTRRESGERRLCFWLYLASIALALGNMISLNFTFRSAQGRLLFPVIAPMCIFIAAGMRSVIVWRWRAHSTGRDFLIYSFILLLAGLNLYALFGVIAPVYP